jgi:hypothetical protein
MNDPCQTNGTTLFFPGIKEGEKVFHDISNIKDFTGFMVRVTFD